jgi:DDE_Tnp_1-associated
VSSSESAAFQDHFHNLKDPRVERTRKHPLINILFIAVCGVLSGANSFAGIQEFGCDRRQWFARYLNLSNGIPSDDTFARVLARLDPAAFEKCLLNWIQAVQEVTESRLIAIDGKTLRGSYDRRDEKAAIPIWSRPGPPRTSCRWAKWSWTRSPMRSRRSPRCSGYWMSPGWW